jgi:hypothetical protein
MIEALRSPTGGNSGPAAASGIRRQFYPRYCITKTSALSGLGLPTAEFKVKNVIVVGVAVNVLVAVSSVRPETLELTHVGVSVTWLPCTAMVVEDVNVMLASWATC